MANKNITLHQKNNSGIYDNLYINTVATKLSNSASLDSELEMTDGNSDSSMNKIASNLKLLGIIHIRVVYEDSSPIQGIVISGLQEDKTTDENGDVYGKIGNTNIITLTSPYADIKDKTVDLTNLYKTPFSILIIQMEHVANLDILRYEISKSVKFSKHVEAVDVCCVGGGGAGSSAVYDKTSQSWYGGAGGGGGGVVNSFNVSVAENTDYPLVVGAGGTCLRDTFGYTNGGDGGETSFMGVVAKGGNGGTRTEGSNIMPPSTTGGTAGAAGCGDGGIGARQDDAYSTWPLTESNNGTSNNSVSEFADGLKFYSGGGGGGKYISKTTGGSGGSPNGARGGYTAYTSSVVHAPTKPNVGGGGGGACMDNVGNKGGDGGNGLVAIRIHLKGKATT